MIYLDYSATTPVSFEVQDTISKVTKEFVGNANSLNALGIKSRELLNSATNQIADLLLCESDEITYTSSATEANNLALIGVAMANHKRGKHIIVSKLEHPSIYAICDYLKSVGFTIDEVNNDNEGLIDFEHLKTLIREDTIIVSIATVNSELGIRQPLKMIRQIIKKENPNTYFHSDMTQAIGKVQVNFKDVDMASMSMHKIYGPKGIGLFYKSKIVKINNLLYGSGKSNMLHPGTPALPLIAGASKALRLALLDLEKHERFVLRLNEKIVNNLKDLENIRINKTRYSIPHILNISVYNANPETIIHALDEFEVYVSTNTACSTKDVSSAVMALYDDLFRAKHTIRISISHLTTTEEINKFLDYFMQVYNKFEKLKKD